MSIQTHLNQRSVLSVWLNLFALTLAFGLKLVNALVIALNLTFNFALHVIVAFGLNLFSLIGPLLSTWLLLSLLPLLSTCVNECVSRCINYS